jgi:GTP-binding protein
MYELGAEEWQLDFPTVYGSAKNNWMSDHWDNITDNVEALLDMVIENVPAPKVSEGTPQMLITSLDFSAFTGRIAIGRLERGVLKEGMPISLCKRDGVIMKSRIKELHTFEGLGRKKVQEVVAGDICAIVNRQDVAVGALINWTDNNNSFIKKINNIEINSLNFKFSNELGEELTDINDWLLTLQITIQKKQHL